MVRVKVNVMTLLEQYLDEQNLKKDKADALLSLEELRTELMIHVDRATLQIGLIENPFYGCKFGDLVRCINSTDHSELTNQDNYFFIREKNGTITVKKDDFIGDFPSDIFCVF